MTYPLVPEEWVRFCAGKSAVLVVEEGQPEFIEQAATQILRQHDVQTAHRRQGRAARCSASTPSMCCARASAQFIEQWAPQLSAAGVARPVPSTAGRRSLPAAAKLAALVPPRPSGLCTGCPERPFFAAMKLLQREIGPLHISADIGCHSFATLPPFNMGNSIMGYGLGAAGASAFGTDGGKRAVADHGRRRFLAQRPDQRHRQRRVQQAR